MPGWPRNWFGCCGADKYLLHVPEMEPQLLGRPDRSLVALPTTQHEGMGNMDRKKLTK